MTHVITVITTPATRIEVQQTDSYITPCVESAYAELARALKGYTAIPGTQIVMWPFTDRKVN